VRPGAGSYVAATLRFTPNLSRHVECPDAPVDGPDVRTALARYFEMNPRARGYVLDDQGAVRWHVAIFLNGQLIRDRRRLSDPVGDGDEIFVAQALSGG
jgi:molybdopterin synthase sulfur carrier subunit